MGSLARARVQASQAVGLAGWPGLDERGGGGGQAARVRIPAECPVADARTDTSSGRAGGQVRGGEPEPGDHL
jgi:hypothetical protein